MIHGRRDDRNISVSDDSSDSHGQNLLCKMQLKCTESLVGKLLHRLSLQIARFSVVSLAFSDKVNYLIRTKVRYVCQIGSYQTSVTTQVLRQNKCPGEIAAIQDTSRENQLVGVRLVQTQSYRIKHYWVRTKVWFWLKTSLHRQPLISSILKHSVPHLLLVFDMDYGKKKKIERVTHLVFWALFFWIRERGGRIDWTVQGRRAVSSGLQLATFPKNSHLSIAAEFLKYRQHTWHTKTGDLIALFSSIVLTCLGKIFHSWKAYTPGKQLTEHLLASLAAWLHERKLSCFTSS